MTELESAIARHPFFGPMPPQQVSLLCEGAQEMRFAPGQLIFRQGEPANRFYLLLTGQVKLECHVPDVGDIPVQQFGGGEALGWSWLLAPFAWQFQARVCESTEVLALNGGHLLFACEGNHEFGYELLKRMSRVIVNALQATRRRLLETGRAHSIPAPPAPPAPLPAPSVPLPERIAEHPFLRDLSGAHLATLANVSMEAHFEPGELIFVAGDPANRFYLLEQGRVGLESAPGGAGFVQILGDGDVLGWSWLFEPYIWHLGARSLTRTRAIFFYGTWLREQCEQDHDFGYELLKRVTRIVLQRLHVTREQLIRALVEA